MTPAQPPPLLARIKMARHFELHRTTRIGWLRAAVLGANDGIISTASLVIGVAAAGADHAAVLSTAIAGLVAGAMSMAAGEYVSVHSQADTEAADVARETAELLGNPVGEQAELAAIYVARGLTPTLAAEVAQQLMFKDAIGAHTSDELGIRAELAAQPLQAALASAASFALGAVLPLIITLVCPANYLVVVVAIFALICLAATGAIAARTGGAPALAGALRVTFWGAAAMAVTAGVGAWFGAIA